MLEKNVLTTDIYHVAQPIVNLQSNQVFGYEFLLRSQHVDNPGLLFQYAKDSNQLVELDKKSIKNVLMTANRQIELLKEQKIFINIFPSTLTNVDFHKLLQKTMSMINILPSQIVFEINEYDSLYDLSALQIVANHLKGQGFIISIDDIGKGFSSLKAIMELEPDIGKLDLYFSKNLSQSPKKQALLKSIIDIFRDNQIMMVLEGLETEEDVQVAKQLGVPFVQGYYLGKPKMLDYYVRRMLCGNKGI